MASNLANHNLPDRVSPPGETLLETLEAIGMSQAGLAERTGRPRKTINEIIKGKAAITAETALQLERVLGFPASFWINRERQYQESRARFEEADHLVAEKEWLRCFPIRDMARWGWIARHKEQVQQLRKLLNFFGVASYSCTESVQSSLAEGLGTGKSRQKGKEDCPPGVMPCGI